MNQLMPLGILPLTRVAAPAMAKCLWNVRTDSTETVTLKDARITFPAILLGKDEIWKVVHESSMNRGNTAALKQAQSALGGLLIDCTGKCYCPTRLEKGKPRDPWWDFKNRLLLGRFYEWQWEFRVEPVISIAETRAHLLEYAENGSCSQRTRRYLRYLAKAQSFDEFSKLILDELKW